MKDRFSNLEALRLVAMLLMLMIHCNYFTLGPVSYEEISNNPFGAFFRIFLQQAESVCVNIFILISGWFRIKFKPEGICKMLFQVLFLGWLVCLLLFPFIDDFPFKKMFRLSFMGSYYWYVISYLILFILSPVLNSFTKNADRHTYKLFLVFFFSIEFLFGWIVDLGQFCLGYSAISFVGLYLLSGYIRKYEDTIKFALKSNKELLFIYLLSTLIPSLIVFACIFINVGDFNIMSFSSPFVICASISLLLFFSKLNFTSRFVNWAASSAFAIYLIQMHPIICPIWKNTMVELYSRTNIYLYMIECCLFSAIFGFLCICIDKSRIYCWEKTHLLINNLKNKHQ